MVMVVDQVIEARWVVPVVPHGVVLEDHAVVVHQGQICGVLPIAEVQDRYLPGERVSLPRHALMPGLVNAHCHAAMTLMRGLADDLPLMTWLNEHIWPAEGALISPAYVADGVELAVAEMLLGGTTAVNDQYFFPEAAVEVYRRMGMRAAVGLILLEFPTPYARNADEYLSRGLALADQLTGDPLLHPCFAPHAPYTVSDDSFRRIRTYADQLGLRVHVHVHETAFEVEDAVRQHHERPLARLKRLGFMGPDLTAVHMTQLTPGEIEDLARHNVVVAHCPESNLKLASGLCPVGELLRAGVALAIGTDGTASNNDLDMFGEMRTAALLAKGVTLDPQVMDAATALHCATLGGARAIGLESRIGSIEVGKRADLAAVDFGTLRLAPVYNPLSHLVYAASRNDVSDVWVDGQRRVRERTLVGVDTERLMANAARWSALARAAVGGRSA
ncbi:MAG: TRZ/ATZ family hydrolase [Rhodanobacteraceae bacterium]|nr:TRZ/ATZ family hydrolase [Rhodanobacteraceae bacterium]